MLTIDPIYFNIGGQELAAYKVLENSRQGYDNFILISAENLEEIIKEVTKRILEYDNYECFSEIIRIFFSANADDIEYMIDKGIALEIAYKALYNLKDEDSIDMEFLIRRIYVSAG